MYCIALYCIVLHCIRYLMFDGRMESIYFISWRHWVDAQMLHKNPFVAIVHLKIPATLNPSLAIVPFPRTVVIIIIIIIIISIIISIISIIIRSIRNNSMNHSMNNNNHNIRNNMMMKWNRNDSPEFLWRFQRPMASEPQCSSWQPQSQCVLIFELHTIPNLCSDFLIDERSFGHW